MPFADLIRRALEVPGAREVLSHVAQQALTGAGRYKSTHWGRKGKGAALVEAPAPDGPLTQLGALARIAYVTRKGSDPEFVEYRHTFRAGPRLPWLYVNAENDLVIIRGESRYTVTSHGIEG